MANLHRDGYDYASDVVSVAGKQRIKLASDAPKLVIGIPIRGEIDEPTLQGPLITTGRTIAPEFMVSMLQCLPPINTSTRFRLVKGKLGGPARDDIINDAIAWNAKYIIFLDDDVLFPDYTFSRLVKNMELYPDIGWLTGVYCTNKIGYSEPLVYQHYGDGAFWDFELNELYDIYASGAGCVIVRVEALKTMNPPWFTEAVQKVSEIQTVLGHDFMVCRRIHEETKYRVVVDTGILCGHIDILRGIVHILPKDAPAYNLSRHKRYFDTSLRGGILAWTEHLPEPVGKETVIVDSSAKQLLVKPNQNGKYARKLLALTACGNTAPYLAEALVSIAKSDNYPSWEILVMYDGPTPPDWLVNIQPPVRVQIKDKAMGVTDSWNRIYQYFKEGNYDVCCLSNDDVLFAPHALDNMASTLGQNGFAMVGPVSNQPGHQPQQALGAIMGLLEGDKYPIPPKNVAEVETYLSQLFKPTNPRKDKAREKPLPYINGFCFMFDRWIANFEHSKDMLFNPENINIGNEDELQRRLRYAGQKVALSLSAYVYHKKFGTMNLPAYRHNRNLLWTEAEEMEKDGRKVGQGV